MSTVAAFLPSIAWTALTGLLFTLADILLRSWFQTHWQAGFWICLAIYILGIVCIMFSFFGEHIAIATILAIILNILFYLAIAWFLFGEILTRQQIIGLILGVAAIAILEYK